MSVCGNEVCMTNGNRLILRFETMSLKRMQALLFGNASFQICFAMFCSSRIFLGKKQPVPTLAPIVSSSCFE